MHTYLDCNMCACAREVAPVCMEYVNCNIRTCPCFCKHKRTSHSQMSSLASVHVCYGSVFSIIIVNPYAVEDDHEMHCSAASVERVLSSSPPSGKLLSMEAGPSRSPSHWEPRLSDLPQEPGQSVGKPFPHK